MSALVSPARLRVAIAGAGVLGRLLAWRLARAGHAVEVFDPAAGPDAPATGRLDTPLPYAAGFTAAGMLSPLAELDGADAEVARLGWRSLALWTKTATALQAEDPSLPPLVQRRGSLLVAHGGDLGAARRVLARLDEACERHADWPTPRPQDRAALATLEPALDPDLKTWLLPSEGQLLPRELLVALARSAPGVRWHWGRRVHEVSAGRLALSNGERIEADLCIDVRGLGARASATGWPAGLRGVRGELVWLHAPGVALARPVRLLHPRHRVYIVPRPDDLFVVGASEIESEDRSAMSLRSAVELMAAAHSVVPALAEARIVHMESNLRPALPDHLPRIDAQPGLLRINGLFRHGWLLAPALAEQALARLPDLELVPDAAHA